MTKSSFADGARWVAGHLAQMVRGGLWLVAAGGLVAAVHAVQITIPAEAEDGAVVTIANGVYEPLDLLTETRTLTLRAATRGGVIIDGGARARCATLPETITLDGFVLQHGKAECGGGVRGGTVENAIIQNCSATFGGGAYQTKVVASIVRNCSAEFFGTALYEGSAFSCRIECNGAADYGAGMAALFGTVTANCAITGNTTPRDTAGSLLSPVQNMIYFGNRATRGSDVTVNRLGVDFAGGVPEGENAFQVVKEVDFFTDAANGDYSLNLDAASSHLKELGDPSLGGYYDLLWNNYDLAGRNRLLGQVVDIGPYEIGDTLTPSCTVIGAGAVTITPAGNIQEGDTVLFTAMTLVEGDVSYARDFLGFYVNGQWQTADMNFSWPVTARDRIEARFAGLTATPETLEAKIAQLHPTRQEVLTLKAGTYSLTAQKKSIVYQGVSPEQVQVTLTGSMGGATILGATVAGTATQVTLHRCVVDGLSGSEVTLTSSILKRTVTNLTGTAVNVTAFGSWPEALTAYDCVTLEGNEETVAGAILPQGSAEIDAGVGGSGVVPFDNLDIAGRPRTMGKAIDRGAHECYYTAFTVTAEGAYESLSPAVGTQARLAGDHLLLTHQSARDFLGWTLNGEALGAAKEVVIPELPASTLTATFAGFSLTSGANFPSGTTAQDTIVLAPGGYVWSNISTEATIVGTGVQGEVSISGSISGGRFEAVTIYGADLTGCTLNRCLVMGGTLTDCQVVNSVLTAGTMSGASSCYINNTIISGVTLPAGAVNTRTVAAPQSDYTPAPGDEAIDAGTALTEAQLALVGDLDYAGQARINNGRIDLGAAEYMWSPQTVMLQVSGHGLVSPRGEVQVVRGQTLFFTATEDPKHPRGEPVVVGAEAVAGKPGVYAVTPTEDVTKVTIAFAGLTVGVGTPYATVSEAIAEAQEGETLTLKPGIYREMVNVKNKHLRLVAESIDPRETIIDAGQKGRAVTLTNGAEIIGMTIQGGVANEGAGVLNGTVRRCIVRNNALTYNGFGGGLSNVFAESCLLYDNGTAALRSAGGGAANSHLLNCTIVRNVAEKGGGLYDCTAKNCIIALNRDGTGATSDWVGDSVDPDPSDCCTPTSGGIAVEAESIFVEPAADDFRLREGIACIDRVSANDFDLSALDLLGHARQFGDAVDMGAIEWDSPDYLLTLTFNCRAQATLAINGANPVSVAWDDPIEARTFAVPRVTSTGERSRVVMTWANADGASTVRTLKGISLDGALLDGSAAATTTFVWEVGSLDTVNVRLTFVADALTIANGDAEALTKSLSEAIAGETIHLGAGAYDTAVTIGEGVTLAGAGADASALLRGAILADGACLTGATVSGAAVIGPASGSARLLHCVVTGVGDGAAVRQGVTLKVCLLHANAAGLGEGTTAYLTTVVDSTGTALAATAKAYGCAVWRYGTLAEDGAEMIDCVLGGDPRFISPAPAGCDYRLTARSPLIDVAGEALWPGFTAEDRALTDLAGLPRNQLLGFDCGAYEYQASATPSTWTWFGSDSSMDGDFAGAGWRQMVYGAPQVIPAGVSALIADRAGFPEATLTLGAGELTLAALEVRTTAAVQLLPGSPVGRIILNGALTKNASGALTLAVPLTAQGNATFSVGETRLLEGAELRCGGTLTVSGSGTRFEQQGGALAFGNFLNVRNTANVVFAGGQVTGGEISVAQGDRTAVTFAGATVTATRIETGDEGGARSGHVLQTGGVVTLTGSGSAKGAPLHIAHWSGNSTYTLRGGELWVPNGEVRLGTDGTGTLRLEGGTANIRSMTIASGALQLAGGTFHALETQTISPVFIAGTRSTLTVAEGKHLTFANANHATHTGHLVLGSGNFTSSAVISGRHLTLSAGTSLTGHVDLGAEKVLTLPIDGEAPMLTGDLRSGTLALAGEMPLNVGRTVLKVTGAVPASLTLQNAGCYTLEKQSEGGTTLIVLTQTSALPPQPEPEEPTPDCPVLTVNSASESWANEAAWSTGTVPAAETPVLVKALVDAELTLPAETLANVTFEVAEGRRLTLAAPSGCAVTTLGLTGAGALSLGQAGLAYSTQNAFAGTLVIASSSQTLTAETMKSQHLRFESNFALGSCYGFTFAGGMEVAEGCQLTCNSSVNGGEVYLEQNTTFVIGNGCTNRFNLTGPETGAVTLQVGISASHTASYGGTMNVADWSIGGSGASTLKLTNAVRLASPPKAGNLVPNNLVSLHIDSGTLALGSAWAMPAASFKSGAGTLALAAGSSIAGEARIEGGLTLAGNLSATAPLRLTESPCLTLPAGARISSSSELVISPGTRVVLTDDLTALPNGDYPLFTTTAQGGLYLASVADVRVEAESVLEGKTVTLTPYLRDDTFGYTLSTQVPNRWTGNGADNHWSTPENWSNGVPSDGDSLIFPALTEAGRQEVFLDVRVAPEAMAIAGNYTFAGTGAILGVPAISQAADTTVTWVCFPAAGSYALATDAVARLTGAAQYEGTLLGVGTFAVMADVTLCNEAINFAGTLTVSDGGHLRLAHPLATGACPVQLTGGALTPLQPMTIADMTLSATAQLNLSVETPLTVTGTFTGEVVSICPTAVPSVVGTWELLHLPDATPRTLRQLAYTEVEAERLAFLQQDEQRILLQVVTTDTLEWAGQREDGQEVWLVKGTTTAIESAKNKILWFGDVPGVTEATVALPTGTRALYVTARGNTALTLTGTLEAPMTLESGASVTLSGAMTPTEMRNYGTITVSHGTLDLTQATSFYGTGVYIIGEGGILKLKPQQLAESVATFRPEGGAIELVTAEDFHYPDNRMPEAIETLAVGGSGKLYLSAFSFPANVRVQSGATLLPEGAQGLKARYVKLEVRERFAGDAILMGNLRLIRDGQLCPWPEGTHIVRFDSGHSNTVQVGLSGTTDRLNFGSGTLEALCSNEDWMYASWLEAGNVTTYGGSNEKRLFFVIDVGTEGVVLSDYALTQTFDSGGRLWTLSLANDLSNWHPTTDQLGPMTHESSVWQDVDILRSPPLELGATWEFPVGRTSALWSALPSTVLLAPEATLDLSGATAQATLVDWLEIATITGDAASCAGTLRLPASLNLTVGTLAVDTLALIGDRVRDRPIHALSAADFKHVTFSLDAANAYVATGTTEFALCDNFTGSELPTLAWPDAANAPVGGGTWQLALRDGVLFLDLAGAKSEVVADLDASIAWEDIQWKDRFGVALDLSAAEWLHVRHLILRVSESLTLSGVPELPATCAVTLDFLSAEEKTLTLSATASRTLPPITVSGTTGGNLLVAPDSAAIALSDICAAAACPYFGASPELLDTLSGETLDFDDEATIGLLCAESGSVFASPRTVRAAAKGFAIRSGTLKMRKVDTFGGEVENTHVRVDAGAALDVDGYPTSCRLTLNGGTLRNSGSQNNNDVGTSKRQLYNISLMADSAIESLRDFNSVQHYYNLQTLALNGHTLTKRGSGAFGFTNVNITGGGCLLVEAGTLCLQANDSPPETTLSGEVTFENAGGTFTVAKAYTLADNATLTCKGNVTITGALTAGANVTLAYDGSVVPPAIASLNRCATLTFSERFWQAVEMNTHATGVVVTLVSSYDSEDLPAFTPKEGYALAKENGALVVTYSGALSEVTALKASVTGDAQWSALAWHDATTDARVTTPMWGVVTAVTLEAAADATVTLDLPLARLTNLTVAASDHTLTLSGELANLNACTFRTFAINGRLVLKAGVLSTIPNALSGSAEIVFEGGTIAVVKGYNGRDKYAYHDFRGRWVVAAGTTLRLASSTENAASIMNWDENVNGTSGQIEVRKGAVLEVTQKNAFGWGNVSDLKDRTMLVVDGGLVRVSATEEEYFRRKMVWRNGAILEHTGSGNLFFTRGCTMVIAGDTTFRGPKPFILRSDGQCDNVYATTFQVSDGATLTVEGQIQSDNSTANRLELTGAGRVLFNGENSYARATTVGAGTTLGGTGAITASPVTFAADGTSQLLVDPFAAKPLTLSGTLTNRARLTLACDLPTAEPVPAVISTNTALVVDNFSAPDHYELSLSEDARTLFLKRKLIVVYDESAPENELSSSASQKVWQAVIDAVERQQLVNQVAGEVKTTVEIYDAAGIKKREESRAEVIDAFLSCFVNHASAEIETAGQTSTATVKLCCDFGISHITLDANHDVVIVAKVEGAMVGSVDFADGVTFSVVDELTGKQWQVDTFKSSATGEVSFTIPAAQLDATASETLLEGFRGTRALKVHVQKKTL